MPAEVAFLVNGDPQQNLSPLERGLHYGDGVFRTLRAKGQLPCDWEAHYQKLKADCVALAIVCPSVDVLLQDIKLLTRHLASSEQPTSIIKIIMTRGVGERGYVPSANMPATRIVLRYPMPHYTPNHYQLGVRLYLCKTRCLQQQLAGVKHLNRLENVLARMEQLDDTYFDGLLLNANAEVIECTSSNIFARYGNHLLTPDLSQFGISGVTRNFILQYAPKLNLKPIVKTMTFPQLIGADEVIICNSILGAFQVREIENKIWSPSPLAEKLRTLLL